MERRNTHERPEAASSYESTGDRRCRLYRQFGNGGSCAGGHEVLVFDNLQQGHRAAVCAGAEFVRGDLASAGEIDAAIARFQPEAVMHFAADSLVGESMQHPFLYLQDNHDPELHLIPIILQVAMGKREKITIFGDDYTTPDGTCIRDYIHVEDLIDAHVLALGALDAGNRIYNLGNGRGFSVKEVVEAARRIPGHDIPVAIGARRAGDPAILAAGSDKIKQELGWNPRVGEIEAIIGSAWHWHQSHPEGYVD